MGRGLASTVSTNGPVVLTHPLKYQEERLSVSDSLVFLSLPFCPYCTMVSFVPLSTHVSDTNFGGTIISDTLFVSTFP